MPGKNFLYATCIFSFLLSALLAASNWRGIEPSVDNDFYLVEDFELKRSWQVKSKHSIQGYGRFIWKQPLFPGTKNIYNKSLNDLFVADIGVITRSAEIFRRPEVKEQRTAYEIQSFFAKPGLDNLEISSPYFDKYSTIDGRPRAFTIWVYGRSKKHTLFAVFFKLE